MVSKNDIKKALTDIGIKPYDVAIFHSSLKSFGTVDGGAQTVIEAARECLAEGTVVFPSLVSHDFSNAYKNWDIKKSPSDVGLISETFRLQDGVLRSDQATHSVTAIGKDALYITSGHSKGRGRYGVFGSTPFSHNSPWQKMYDLDGKVVLLGVSMTYNTFKHFVEYCFADDILSVLESDERECAIAELSSWEDMQKFTLDGIGDFPRGVWFWNNGMRQQDEMKKRGLLNQTTCGDAVITSFKIKDFYKFLYTEFENNPERWLNQSAVEWIKKYKK